VPTNSETETSKPWLTIIGIGEDGVAGLSQAARQAIAGARVIFGGARHLDLLAAELPGEVTAERIAWPTPFAAAYELLLARRGTPVCVLASGDPMHYGIGATLTRSVPAEEMLILPAPSSYALAAARMVWPLQTTALLTVHGRPLELLHPHLHPGAKLLILSNDGASPAQIAQLLTARGFGASTVTVLEHLGGPLEKRHDGIARDWQVARTADLNVVAVACHADHDARAYSTLAGLPDDAFTHEGQITKRDVRAVTLARLAPLPGELLWDVGAGSGSIGIEWMRAHPTCRAIAIEPEAERRALIERNRADLGVPGLRIVAGYAPAALEGLETPDAIFIGGGVTDAGVIETCWDRLKPGGRLVANAVTVQSEMLLVQWLEKAGRDMGGRDRMGGELTRIAVSQAKPLGGFDAWRAALPVTILSCVKPR
jgi:precorrin-6Y C5,15-methyltransferase (decarboxylating)